MVTKMKCVYLVLLLAKKKNKKSRGRFDFANAEMGTKREITSSSRKKNAEKKSAREFSMRHHMILLNALFVSSIKERTSFTNCR